MMQSIRDHATGKPVKILFGMIILSFIGWGASGYLDRSSDFSAGKVNSEEIDANALKNEFDQLLSTLSPQQIDSLDEAQRNQLKKQAFDNLAKRILVTQHIQALKLAASKNEIREQLMMNPAFLTNGQFDRAKYDNLLNQYKISPETYEQSITKQIISGQLMQGLLLSTPKPEKSLQDYIENRYSQRSFKVATFSFNELLDNTKISKEDIEKEFNAHPGRYKKPEQVKLKYVEISKDQAKNEISVSDEEAKAVFEQSPDLYHSPEKREATQLMIISNQNMTQEKAVEKLNQYKTAIANGSMSFEQAIEDLIKESKQNGNEAPYLEIETGTLGELAKGELGNNELDQTIFNLEKNQMSEVIITDLGVHLLKLVNITPEKKQEFESVKSSIIDSIKDKQALSSYLKLQDKFQQIVENQATDLDKIASEMNSKVIETDFLDLNSQQDLLAYDGVLSEISSDAVLKQGKLSLPIALGEDKAVVIQVEKHEPERALTLEEASGQIEVSLKVSRAKKELEDQAQEFKNALEKDSSQFDSLAQVAKAEVITLDKIKMEDINGQSPAIQNALFLGFNKKIEQTDIIMSEFNFTGISVALVYDVSPGKLEDINPEELKQSQEQILLIQSIAEVNAYINSLKANAKISINSSQF